jgi:hypothetical protein
MSERHPRGGPVYQTAGRLHTLERAARGAAQSDQCEGTDQVWLSAHQLGRQVGPAEWSWFECSRCGSVTRVMPDQVDNFIAAEALIEQSRVYHHQALALDEMAATGVVYAAADAARTRAKAKELVRIAAKLAPTEPVPA